jgi:hypothetical protein
MKKFAHGAWLPEKGLRLVIISQCQKRKKCDAAVGVDVSKAFLSHLAAALFCRFLQKQTWSVIDS